jgi:hypothetical protein
MSRIVIVNEWMNIYYGVRQAMHNKIVCILKVSVSVIKSVLEEDFLGTVTCSFNLFSQYYLLY